MTTPSCTLQDEQEISESECLAKIGDSFSGVIFVDRTGLATFAVDQQCNAFMVMGSDDKEVLLENWNQAEIGEYIRPLRAHFEGMAAPARLEGQNPVFTVEKFISISPQVDESSVRIAEQDRFGCSLILRDGERCSEDSD